MDTSLESKKNKIGVLLIGHGSRLPYGEEVIKELAQMYQKKEDYLVEFGFMNMSQPSIPAALKKLVEAGVEKIVVTPVFLAHGVHTKKDIPHILGIDHGQDNEHSQHHNHHEQEEKIEYSGEIIYTEPLGADRRLVDIIKDRVDNAL
jgi:sirohydrochlorin cobalto/nickelchelatase